MIIVRRKSKQSQKMIAELSPPMSVENIQLNLKQKINTNDIALRGCSLLPVVEWYVPLAVIVL